MIKRIITSTLRGESTFVSDNRDRLSRLAERLDEISNSHDADSRQTSEKSADIIARPCLKAK